jgi:lincosamide nucleotidyltransferase A/C/D/E
LGRPDPPFTYREVGATANRAAFAALAGKYALDQHRFVLGNGCALFERARAALLAWRHFEIPWLELHGGSAPACAGQVVATLTRAAGLWFLNPCRVVYVEGTATAATEVAFAYGTLAGHAVSGEERFAVAFDPEKDEVTYEIRAFSRPVALLTKLARSRLRRVQKRFARSSAEALARAVRCEMTAAALVELMQLFETEAIDVWLEGGWGVDALLGRQTRPHKDLDVILQVADLPRLRAILGRRGFGVRAGGTPSNFVLADHAGREVDVHAVEFDRDGNGIYRMADGRDWIFPARGFAGRGNVDDLRVRCLTPEVQVLCHGPWYAPTENDLQDMERLHERFGVDLPSHLRRGNGR